MIRLFLTLCKVFRITKNNNDYQIYLDYKDNANLSLISCPFYGCGSTGNYDGCGSYNRTLICYTNYHVETYSITINRIECVSCGCSHAILPPVIVPHSPFSFHFVISLLYDFITHKYPTVKDLCLNYDISISTLYRIYHRFIDDRKLMLGMIEAASTDMTMLLDTLSQTDFFHAVNVLLQTFYKSYGVSFLQARCTIRLSLNRMHST